MKREREQEFMELMVLIPALLIAAVMFLQIVTFAPEVPEWLKAVTTVLVFISIITVLYRYGLAI
jgi:hypothetical protein